MYSKKKHNIDYVKPEEPAFITRLKAQAGYVEGPSVDTKVISYIFHSKKIFLQHFCFLENLARRIVRNWRRRLGGQRWWKTNCSCNEWWGFNGWRSWFVFSGKKRRYIRLLSNYFKPFDYVNQPCSQLMQLTRLIYPRELYSRGKAGLMMEPARRNRSKGKKTATNPKNQRNQNIPPKPLSPSTTRKNNELFLCLFFVNKYVM